VWASQIAPSTRGKVHSELPATTVQLDKGEEMGRFKLGSTVVLLFGKDAVSWDTSLSAGAFVHMGQRIGAMIAQ
jgi:phosphatidylserine decarboxylase